MLDVPWCWMRLLEGTHLKVKYNNPPHQPNSALSLFLHSLLRPLLLILPPRLRLPLPFSTSTPASPSSVSSSTSASSAPRRLIDMEQLDHVLSEGEYEQLVREASVSSGMLSRCCPAVLRFVGMIGLCYWFFQFWIISLFLWFVLFLDKTWKMYFVGFLFGLGFDTATEVRRDAVPFIFSSRCFFTLLDLLSFSFQIALVGLSAVSAQGGTPVYVILILPFLFAAGMMLIGMNP